MDVNNLGNVWEAGDLDKMFEKRKCHWFRVLGLVGSMLTHSFIVEKRRLCYFSHQWAISQQIFRRNSFVTIHHGWSLGVAVW
jgi:hypothetical protein